MKKINKFLSVLLTLMMIISIIPMSTITASAETVWGECGDNLIWAFDFETSILTISGTGNMYDYDSVGEGKAPWSSYKSLIDYVIIESGITSIGKYAFGGCPTQSVIIPDGVTSIGYGAFYMCSSLTSVTIPNSVTKIGGEAFSNCTSLTSITIGDSLTLIDDSVFSNCTSLTSIKIGDGVTSIGDNAFYNCTSLTGVTIPDSVTSIGEYAFYNCSSLISITIGNCVKSIGGKSFYNTAYYNDTSNWENDVLYIDNYLIKANISISDEYLIKEGTLIIADSAFENCTSLTSITIPDSVIAIGDWAFFCCESLSKITIPDSVTSLGGSAFFYTAYYNDTSNWEDNILYNNNKLITARRNSIASECVIKDGTILIGEYAFNYCTNLTSITIPASVISINGYAFNECTALTDVYYTGSEEQWNNIAIDNTDNYNGYLLNATFHFNHTGHICSFSEWAVVLEPTCTEAGSKTRTCECGNEETEDIPATGHSYKTTVTAPTCTTAGYTTYTCVECTYSYTDNETTATGHTAGEWETVLEPTYEANGKKVQKCTVCDEIVEEEVIPMFVKNTVTDEETGISMDYNKDDYSGEIEIVVEESFDSTAFVVIDTSLNASQRLVYDIIMTVDGVATQPNGSVTIRIPLPAGYDPNRSFVYHVNTETGTVEKMPATYEDGYMVFETTHFSYYAIIEEYNYTFSIQTPSKTEIRNKDGIILRAKVDGTSPAGSYVVWTSSNGNFDEDADGNNLTVIAKNKGYTTFTAILCAEDGTELARDSVELYSKSGFFDKIGGFFRSLFDMTKIYEN